MVDAAPFRALRYHRDLAGDPLSTSAPAYDDLTPFAYARHRTASPYTVLELMAGSGAGEPDRYEAAAAAYERWCRTGVLRLDEAPSLYRYEQHWLRGSTPAVQRGLLAAVRLGDATVLAHEHVDPARVRERLQRLEAVPVDLSPVFALYSHHSSALADLVHSPPTHPPVIALTDEEGVDHRLWRLTEPARVAAITDALAAVQVVIADGHHRYATATALRDARDPAGRDEAMQRTLMLLVDTATAGPEVRGIHRLVRTVHPDGLASLEREFAVRAVPGSATELVDALSRAPAPAVGLLLNADAARRSGLSATPRRTAGFVLFPPEPDEMRTRLPSGHSAAWYRLDATLLEHLVLPALRVRPEAVAHRVQMPGAEAEVAAGAADALFVLRPVEPEAVFDIAAAGDTLPAKTTWFYPKPRTGLVLRPLRLPPEPMGRKTRPPL